ncbi:MAG: asparagine--tRNA ligase [Clostridiales bacterium]|nr:asparagine--tRNA ligase [Clostridiales bacterium]
MEKTDIKELYNLKVADGEKVLIKGWVRTTRDSKVFGFLEVNDGTCLKNAQVVLEKNVLNNFDEVVKLNMGSTVYVKGSLVLTPQNKQPFEIKAEQVQVFQATDETYPIQKKRASVEYLREIAYLRPRTNMFNAIFRVRSECAFAIHKFFHEKGFVYAHTPILTASDCEGGSQLFRVTTQEIYGKDKLNAKDELFGKPVYLTPTGQLEGECFAQAFGKIYTFGPTFRAENSNTTRHANEFWMIEPEVCFADLDDLMDLEEEMIKFIINHIFDTCKNELELLNNFVDKTLIEKLNNVRNSKFGRITYTDAIELMKKNNDNFQYKVEWGIDIQTEHERYMAETVFGCPVFITDYPKDIKAFYMKQNDDGKTVRACDLVVPGIGELCGGSQREEDYTKLANRINEVGLKEQDYWWYMNLRKYGSCIHSGFGIGFERLVMYVTGAGNIRDVLPFPRTPNNCEY